jgi:hypothetical protein
LIVPSPVFLTLAQSYMGLGEPADTFIESRTPFAPATRHDIALAQSMIALSPILQMQTQS